MNTDVSTGEGYHWVTCKRLNNIMYFVDSLGPKNYRVNDEITFDILKKNNIKPYFYPGSMQYKNNVWCGWFSILIASEINKLDNPTKESITKLLDELFKTDRIATDEDENVIIERFGIKGNIEENIDGGSIFNFGEIGRRLRGVRMALTSGYRTNLSPLFRENLAKIGDVPIIKMEVRRRVLGSTFSKALQVINTLTFHSIPHDKMFHLFILCYLKDGSKYILEKLQQLNLVSYDKANKIMQEGEEEVMSIPIPPNLTINNLMNTAMQKINKERLFKYNAFSNNCQQFVIDLLDSNNIQTSSDIRKWIQQDVSNLMNHFGQKIAQFATDTKSKLDLIKEGEGQMGLHSVKFPLKKFNNDSSLEWLNEHNIKPIKQGHNTKNYIQYRIKQKTRNQKYYSKKLKNGVILTFQEGATGAGFWDTLTNIDKTIAKIIPAYGMSSIIPYTIANMAKHGAQQGLSNGVNRITDSLINGATGTLGLLGLGNTGSTASTASEETKETKEDQPIIHRGQFPHNDIGNALFQFWNHNNEAKNMHFPPILLMPQNIMNEFTWSHETNGAKYFKYVDGIHHYNSYLEVWTFKEAFESCKQGNYSAFLVFSVEKGKPSFCHWLIDFPSKDFVIFEPYNNGSSYQTYMKYVTMLASEGIPIHKEYNYQVIFGNASTPFSSLTQSIGENRKLYDWQIQGKPLIIQQGAKNVLSLNQK